MTVVHRDDEWLLRLQARSMRLYLPPSLAGEIVVVENFAVGPPAEWRDRVRADYGHLADRVRFVPAGTLGRMPPATGWWTQQVLKLLVSRVVACDRYVVLDAKNHLVRRLCPDFLEGADGRLLARRYCYRRHPLRHFLQTTLSFCDLPAEPHVGWFIQASTPFTVDRHDAQAAIKFVEGRTAKRFADALIEAKITEFFLLGADLTRRGVLEDRYDFSQMACPVVWESMAEPAALLPVIREVEACRAPIFAVHRRAIPRLGDVSRAILGQFWQSRGLFGSTQEAIAEMALHTS